MCRRRESNVPKLACDCYDTCTLLAQHSPRIHTKSHLFYFLSRPHPELHPPFSQAFLGAISLPSPPPHSYPFASRGTCTRPPSTRAHVDRPPAHRAYISIYIYTEPFFKEPSLTSLRVRKPCTLLIAVGASTSHWQLSSRERIGSCLVGTQACSRRTSSSARLPQWRSRITNGALLVKIGYGRRHRRAWPRRDRSISVVRLCVLFGSFVAHC